MTGIYGCGLCNFANTLENVYLHMEDKHGVTPTVLDYIDADEKQPLVMRFHLQDGTIIYYDMQQDFAKLEEDLRRRIQEEEGEE